MLSLRIRLVIGCEEITFASFFAFPPASAASPVACRGPCWELDTWHILTILHPRGSPTGACVSRFTRAYGLDRGANAERRNALSNSVPSAPFDSRRIAICLPLKTGRRRAIFSARRRTAPSTFKDSGVLRGIFPQDPRCVQ